MNRTLLLILAYFTLASTALATQMQVVGEVFSATW
jgi:hypothetical protein